MKFPPWLRRTADPIRRIYAIGDIHGRFDLFDRLVAIIGRDHTTRGSVPARLILLGDIVDRGPDSARMVRGCMALTGSTRRLVVLKGNHEQMMVAGLRGDFPVFERWLAFGGRETLISFGLDAAWIDRGPSLDLLRASAEAVGPAVLAWLDALPLTCRHDDHLFVHAGIRPGVRLSRQVEDDLLWIGKEFLDSEEDHGVTVVHGHSIHTAGADIRANRIGIDTGAFRTGRLTALGLEGGEVWTLLTDTRSASAGRGGHTERAADDYYARMVAATRTTSRSDL